MWYKEKLTIKEFSKTFDLVSLAFAKRTPIRQNNEAKNNDTPAKQLEPLEPDSQTFAKPEPSATSPKAPLVTFDSTHDSDFKLIILGKYTSVLNTLKALWDIETSIITNVSGITPFNRSAWELLRLRQQEYNLHALISLNLLPNRQNSTIRITIVTYKHNEINAMCLLEKYQKINSIQFKYTQDIATKKLDKHLIGPKVHVALNTTEKIGII